MSYDQQVTIAVLIPVAFFGISLGVMLVVEWIRSL
jgi:surfactin synthase thioesterase subunit